MGELHKTVSVTAVAAAVRAVGAETEDIVLLARRVRNATRGNAWIGHV